MEPIVDDMGVANRVFTGTAVADQVHLRRDSSTGKLVIESTSEVATFESITFADPTASLMILLGFNAAGTDEHVVVDGLGDFAADLIIHGTIATVADFNACVGADPDNPPEHPSCPPEDGPDTVTFTGDTAFHGHRLAVYADTIIVSPNVVLDTRRRDSGGATIGDSGAISLTGATIEVKTGAHLEAGVTGTAWKPGDIGIVASIQPFGVLTTLAPVDVAVNTASVSIIGATIVGGGVTVSAIAEDLAIPDDFGTYGAGWLGGLKNLVDQVPDLVLSSLTGISGQVSVRYATALVTLTGAVIMASGSVKLASSASTNASIQAVSFNGTKSDGKFAVAIAYGQAYSRAETTVQGTSIVAGDGVDISSTAATNAFVKARTSANSGGASNSKVTAIAIAIANTNETSHTSIDQSSAVTTPGSVSIAASGSVTNFAWAQPTIGDDGNVSLAIAVDVDVADIKTTVDGSIDAGGQVTPEADPDSSCAPSWCFDATPGHDVDYANNTIHLPDHGLYDGQPVLYMPGTFVGPTTTTTNGIPAIRFACAEHSTGCPLVFDGETVYYVQVVDKDTIRLALAPTIAIHYDPPATPPVNTPIHTIGRLDTSVFDSALVSGNTIGIPAQPFQPGTVVRYLGSPAIPSGVTDPSWTRMIGGLSGTTITINGHGWTGDFGVIYTGASAPISKLVGGQPYIVHVVDPNHIVLRELVGGVLTDVSLDSSAAGASIQLTSYRGVIGLDQGAAYKVVVVDSAHVTLTTLDDVPVTIFWRGLGTHTFLFEKDIASFDPASEVSSTSNTISFTTPHGFKTGDAVIYRTADLTHPAPMPPAQFTEGLVATSATSLTMPADRTALLVAGAQVTGIVDGAAFATTIVSASYDDATKLTTLVLADPVLAVGKPFTGIVVQLLDPVTFMPLERTVYDTPVSGLQDAYLYYVVKVDDLHHPAGRQRGGRASRGRTRPDRGQRLPRQPRHRPHPVDDRLPDGHLHLVRPDRDERDRGGGDDLGSDLEEGLCRVRAVRRLREPGGAVQRRQDDLPGHQVVASGHARSRVGRRDRRCGRSRRGESRCRDDRRRRGPGHRPAGSVGPDAPGDGRRDRHLRVDRGEGPDGVDVGGDQAGGRRRRARGRHRPRDRDLPEHGEGDRRPVRRSRRRRCDRRQRHGDLPVPDLRPERRPSTRPSSCRAPTPGPTSTTGRRASRRTCSTRSS